MFPILFKIGPLTLHSYGLLVALGVYIGMQTVIYFAKREGFTQPNTADSIYRLFFYIIIGGMIGGRGLYVILYRHEFTGDFLSIFKVWQGGLVSYGGLIGALSGFWLWNRTNAFLPWRKCIDWFSPALGFGHALGRLGCFFAGCCYGRPTGGPLGLIFTRPESLAPLGEALHPAQVYESVFLLGLGAYSWKKLSGKIKNKNLSDGTIFLRYLLIYSLGRFVLEFFRGDEPKIMGMTHGQILSGFVFLSAAFFTRKLSCTVLEKNAKTTEKE